MEQLCLRWIDLVLHHDMGPKTLSILRAEVVSKRLREPPVYRLELRTFQEIRYASAQCFHTTDPQREGPNRLCFVQQDFSNSRGCGQRVKQREVRADAVQRRRKVLLTKVFEVRLRGGVQPQGQDGDGV